MRREQSKAVVTGAAGFIGHHLCRYLKERDYWVRAVDHREPPEWSSGVADEMDWTCDLRAPCNAVSAVRGMDAVFALAADMGGMGYISEAHYAALRNNATININTADAILATGQARHVCFTSSACVYPEDMQMVTGIDGLVESDAWRGKPDLGYGVEKLWAEELYERLAQLNGFAVALPRLHNIYGPEGTWRGGREKAPAALCRKVAEAMLGIGPRHHNVEIEIWGDGEQTRSFCYIDDCLDMLYALVMSGYDRPMNIGTDEAVSINELACIVGRAAGINMLYLKHVEGPQGVRGRNADLTLMHEVLGIEPKVSLVEGIRRTYPWIAEQVRRVNE